ncbi:MAG: hypothetical protein MJB12_21255 [Firmicutes bacterium]|nr:hypothetical protein [Bacillota bacterium]
MKKILLIVIIIGISLSACSHDQDDSVQKDDESGVKIEQEQIINEDDIMKKHLNSEEVDTICYISPDKNTMYYTWQGKQIYHTSQRKQLIYAEMNNGDINIKKAYDIDFWNRMVFSRNVFVNEMENILYCSSNNEDGSQSLLSVDMNTGEKKDVLKGIDIFSEYTPSYYFNYHKGALLFQLRKKDNDDGYNYWGLFDTNNNQARLFNVKDIIGLQPPKVYSEMFVVGVNKIMIVAPQGDYINLFYTDFTGKVIKTVKGIERYTSYMRHGLSACHVSPDGKYLLFSVGQTPIALVLFDIENATEYVVLDGSDGMRMYSSWLNNNTFIYQVQSEDKREIRTVDVDEFIKNYIF